MNISKRLEEYIETSCDIFLIIRTGCYQNGLYRQKEEAQPFNISLESLISKYKQNGYISYLSADLIDNIIQEFRYSKNKTIGRLFLKSCKEDLFEESAECQNLINSFDKEIKNTSNNDLVNQLLENFAEQINQIRPTIDVKLSLVASSGYLEPNNNYNHIYKNE
ncbi:hypothetical protein TTHMIC_00013 [Tetrahymena thermophila SB210]|uniref:Uncharacterized protein n=1 Tax=Tetrahymena thermophila (strain SB210) TaxID=312017 RepID=A0A1B9C266_TETTS|nr:hypothetical protein TTHMIC_00013 [Tetrahymena thermophila SB210]